MYLPSKIIGVLVFVVIIQFSLQKSYRPIIDGLKLKSPYYVVGNVESQQRNLIKHHSMKSEFSMICKNVNDIPMVNKEQIQSIIQIAISTEDIAAILKPLLYFKFPTIVLLITDSLQRHNLKDLKILIHQQILFYFDDTQELF